MNVTTLSHDLIRLIRGKAIEKTHLERAAVFALDAVANALAGRNTEAGRKLLQWGAGQGGDAGRRAFVTGGLTHILETDDLHRASVTHPGCVVVPAALAVAERQGSSGIDMLRSVLHGFEAMCRVGMAVGPAHYRVWHNTATCGPFGSAMATASLLDLSDEQAVYALGNAGTQSAGLWQFLQTGAMSKHLHAGRAAEAGIVAADLAALDFTGAPAILEGDKGLFAATCPDADPAKVVAGSGSQWQLTFTSIKPWPCCRHAHPAIDAALELHHELAGRGIESVTVQTYQAAMDVCDRPQPNSEYEARFSLQHCVAVALDAGSVGFESFTTEVRERFARLRGCIDTSVAEPYASAYPASWGSGVTVKTKDGRTLSSTRSGARGDPELALTDHEMTTKAGMLLDFAGYDAAGARKVIDGVLGLADESRSPHILGYISQQLR